MQDPKTLEATKKVVMAAMKLLYAKETRPMLDQIVEAEEITPEILALNAAGILKMIWERSGGKVPPGALPAAAMVFVFEMASFLRDSGKKIPKEVPEKASILAINVLRENMVKAMGNKGGQPQQGQPEQAPQQPQQPQPQQPQQPAGLIGGAMQGA